MDEFMQFLTKTFQFLINLFPKYQWWLAGIIGLTVLLMIPINLLIKKCFSKANNVALVRLRKSLSSLLVYGVAAGVLYLYQWLVPVAWRPDPEIEKNFNFIYVVSDDLWSIGTLSMATWWLIKLIKDVGFGAVIAKIAESKEIKSLIASCGVDSKIVNSVLESIEDVLKDSVADGSATVDEYITQHQVTIAQQANYFLNGYTQIEKGQIPEAVKVIVDIINSKHKIEK